jgi:hypothetical protein
MDLPRVKITLEFEGRNLVAVTGAGSDCHGPVLAELSQSQQDLLARVNDADLGQYVRVLQVEDTAAQRCCTLCRLPSGQLVLCCWPC